MPLLKAAALAALLLLLPLLSACALILPAVGTMACMGVDYSSKNCPKKTFTCELEGVHEGVLEALDSMSMDVTRDEATKDGRKVKAEAKGVHVTVDIARLTDTTTKVSVDAAKNIILRDGATACEIVAQVERAIVERAIVERAVVERAVERRGAGALPEVVAGPGTAPGPAGVS